MTNTHRPVEELNGTVVPEYSRQLVTKLSNLLGAYHLSECGRRGGLMVSALDSGSSPGRGHGVVFLGKTLYSHSASLHPGV